MKLGFLPSDQFELDVVADVADGTGADAPVTSNVSAEIFSGISKEEGAAPSISLTGRDVDVEARATYILSQDQFAASLKYLMELPYW